MIRKQDIRRAVEYNNLSTVLSSGCAPCSAFQAQREQEMLEDMPSDQTVAFSGILAFEGETTGDGRYIEPGALRWEGLPLPLRWVREEQMGHMSATLVGRLNTLERDGKAIKVTGDLYLGNEEGREFVRLNTPDDDGNVMFNGGLSMDLDDVDFEIRVAEDVLGESMFLDEDPEAQEVDEDGRVTIIKINADDELFVTTEARVRAGTAVAIPAFAGAKIAIDVNTLPESLTAAVIGSLDLPIADRDLDWDGAAATNRVFDLCSDGDDVDVECVSRAFLYRDEDADPETRAAYKLGFADVVNDQLQIVPRGVAAAAGGRGVDAADIPEDEKDRIKSRICSLYDVIRDKYDDWPDCPFDDDNDNSVQASATITSLRMYPPRSWFDDPKLDGPTPLQITEDGHVYGHIALWDSCHTAYAECVQPPRSQSNYAYFHTGAVLCADGSEVAVGRLTMGTKHAGRRLSVPDVLAHYEHTGVGAVDIRVGEDAYGVWAAGVLRPKVSDEQIRELRASPPSGDWRRIGGSLELVHVLAVNSPGFPVPRAMVASGVVVSLQSAGMLPSVAVHDNSDVNAIADAVAAVLEKRARDRKLRVARNKVLVASAASRVARARR